jgi:hypothetical protein
MSSFVDASGQLQLALAALCLLSVEFLKLRIDARLTAQRSEIPIETRPSRIDRLSAFLDEAADALRVAQSSVTTDAEVSALLDDFHGRVTMFLLSKFGASTARKLHAHQGYRLFSGAYAASLSDERIRICRHLETDLRRLREFLNRERSAESAAGRDSPPESIQSREAA